jgi:ParB family chromosome partitioning protein
MTKPKLIELDPNTITVDENVRRDLGDLRGLTRSVKELGVLEPAVVVADGDGYRLLFGQRRRAAAIAAERPLPCIVASSGDEAHRIASQLAENFHRKDLTPGEEAAAYAQLAMLDMSDTAIARATGVSRNRVTAARKVGESEVAVTVAERYDLTLDQAAVIAEFADDGEAVKALTVAARKEPGQFPHVASRLRQDRQDQEAHAAAVATLTEAGVTVVDARPVGAAHSIRSLTDDDLHEISDEAHASCPGDVVYVPLHTPDSPEHYCLDPEANGHRSLFNRNAATAPAPTPMTDDEKAERREVIENNKAWRAAEPVRRDWIRSLLARKTPPKGTLRYVTEAILGRPDRVGDGKEDLLADLLGVDAPAGYGRSVGAGQAAKANDAQLPLALLAQVATDQEQTMGVHTWRHSDATTASWLTFLASTGYSLSDIEQHVINAVEDKPKAA